MTTTLQAAKSHFKKLMSDDLKFIDVQEWIIDDEPVRIFFKASMTLKQEEKILALNEKGQSGRGIALSVIYQSRNEDGEKMFKIADIDDLMSSVSPEILSRIVVLMAAEEPKDFTEDDLEELAKN